MATSHPSRRGFLGHVAGAYVAAAALPVAAIAVADPLSDAIDAYLQENLSIRAKEDSLDVGDTPAFDYLAYGDLPTPPNRESAIKTLRLAIDEHEQYGGDEIILNLMGATLAYLEAQPA